MSWVLSSHRSSGTITFYIGAVRIATISFLGKTKAGWVVLFSTADCNKTFEGPRAVSDAMKFMHELLNSPVVIPEEADDS